MNLYEFIQFKKLGHTERKSYPIKGNKITLLKKLLIKEKDFQTFKLNLKNFAFIIKGNDKKTIDNINSATETTLKMMLDFKDGFPFNYQYGQEKGVLFPYHGSKKNHRSRGNETIEFMLKNGNSIKKSIDLFAGAGNLTFDNLYLFDKYKVEKVYMNDFNIFVSSTYYNIQNNVDEVFEEYSKIIFWIKEEFKDLNLKKVDELEILQNYLIKELDVQTIKREYTPKTTALFIFLQHISRSGKIDYDAETKKLNYDEFRSSTDPYQLVTFSNVINKLFFYNETLNIMDIEIMNEDYNNIINRFLEKDCLLLIDSPYADFDEKELKSGGINYADNIIESIDFGNNFNQFNLLNYIKEHKGSYIYWNNHHKEIELFSTHNLKNSKYKGVSVTYGDSNREKIEIWMYANYLSIEDIENLDVLEDIIDEYVFQKQSINECDIKLQEEDKQEFFHSRYNLFSYIEIYLKRNEPLPYQLLKYKNDYDLYMIEQPAF